MTLPKGYVEEILGISFRARHKVNTHGDIGDRFQSPIIHRQIHGNKVYTPLKRDLWDQY